MIRPEGPAFSFDAKLPQAQEVARKQAAKLVTRTGLRTATSTVAQTRLALRELILAAIRDGIPPYEVARQIRDMVGMDAQRAEAAWRYRRRLVDSGLPTEKVEREMSKYVANAIKARALTIARSEIIDALVTGQLEAGKQAQDDGLLGGSAIKEWAISGLLGKRKPCDTCMAMNGKRVKLREKFTLPNGKKVDGPGRGNHPRDRCSVIILPR